MAVTLCFTEPINLHAVFILYTNRNNSFFLSYFSLQQNFLELLLKLNWAPFLFGFKRADYHNCKQVYVTYNLFKNKDEKYNNLTMFKNS